MLQLAWLWYLYLDVQCYDIDMKHLKYEASKINDQKNIFSWNAIVHPEEYHRRIVHIWGIDVWSVERVLVSPWDWLECYMNEPDYLKNEWALYE